MDHETRMMAITIAIFFFWAVVIIGINTFLSPISQLIWIITGVSAVVLLVASDIKKKKKVEPVNMMAIILGPVGLLSILSIMLYISIRSRRYKENKIKGEQN
ncbi:hypothetical protein LCGC14_0969950 [marine sediment metagenome]|uniref:Uncharacterized protein n=1 Tax=marine sediment metagenome TaxID=412755 RepID=A0A0F9QV55_9ZZZZ